MVLDNLKFYIAYMHSFYSWGGYVVCDVKRWRQSSKASQLNNRKHNYFNSKEKWLKKIKTINKHFGS